MMPGWRYEAENGMPLPVEVADGEEPPAVVTYKGLDYYPVHPGPDVAALRAMLAGMPAAVPTRPSLRDGRHASYQACRWDPDAPYHTPDGKPAFTSRRERDEWAARKTGETGLEHRWGEL